MKPITVQCHDGARAAEYPLCFFINKHKVEIMRIEKQWLTPGCRCFQVLGDNGRVYVLEYQEFYDTWTLLRIS